MATNLSDWSQINVQLFNFHALGSTAWGNRDGISEPTGVVNSSLGVEAIVLSRLLAVDA